MKKLVLIGFMFCSLAIFGQEPEIFTSTDGAINGYDAVAYFKENKPVKGDAKITYTWKGAVWQFASAANREAFQKNPEKYAPQYGGYCAYGLAGGYKASTQPDAWSIVNGKLYLNYNSEVQKSWSEKKDEMIKKADANWPEVKKKNK